MEGHLEERIFKIGICDSNPEIIQKYVNFFEKWLESKKKEYHNCKVQIYGFLTEHEVYEYLINDKKSLDLLLQSMETEKEKDASIFKEVQIRQLPLNIIFLTNYVQSDLKVYPWKKCFFCLKDEMEQWMPQVIDKVWNERNQQKEHIFAWEWNRRKNVVFMKDILYCERDLRVTHLHHINGEEKCHLKLNELEEIFNQGQKFFCRCHNSFLVNLEYVEKIDRYELKLKNREIVPISRSHRKKTLEKYHDMISKQMKGLL